MSHSALNIADTIIDLSRKRGTTIDNLKLQKLMYYCQGWYVTFNDTTLFNEGIEAWVHGPVVPVVFRKFKEFRKNDISCEAKSVEDEGVIKHIHSVLEVYGKYDGIQLMHLTHKEKPWLDARKGLAADESGNSVISCKSMNEYFSGLLNA